MSDPLSSENGQGLGHWVLTEAGTRVRKVNGLLESKAVRGKREEKRFYHSLVGPGIGWGHPKKNMTLWPPGQRLEADWLTTLLAEAAALP